MENLRKALIIGSSGLVGSELLSLLLDNSSYEKVILLGRSEPKITHSKIEFHKVDMNHILQETSFFNVNDVFCTLGTTMKKAGSKEAFRAVDYKMIVDSAKAAGMYGAQFMLVSAVGANPQSMNFYLKTKGETERDVMHTTCPTVHLMRPSFILGNRQEERLGEKIGIVIAKILNPFMLGSLKKYRGIQAKDIAKAMIVAALKNSKGTYTYETHDIKVLANNYK